MLFKVQNRGSGKSTHCGVLEFSADEGMVYMPYWVRHMPPTHHPWYPHASVCYSSLLGHMRLHAPSMQALQSMHRPPEGCRT